MKKSILMLVAAITTTAGTLLAGFHLIDDIYWAPGFDQANFESVEVGDLKAETKDVLGEPLTVWKRKYYDEKGQPSFEVWDYTKSPNDSSYAMRQIEFDDEGRVRKKIDMFWWD